MKMKHLVLILYVHLFLSYTVGVSDGFTDWLRSISNISKHKRSKRGLYQFKGIINCLQPWVDILQTYADYGCYCGFLGKGRPLDDTDKCCYLHDHCYNAGETIKKTFAESMSGMYLTGYKFDCVEGEKITCRNDLNSEYQQHFCECDRLAAECFLYSRRSYNGKLFDIDTNRYCEKNADLTELKLGAHTLGKLYSCDMKMQDDKCCLDKGFNSVYETCCNDEIRQLIPGASCCGNEYKVLNSTARCCDNEIYDMHTHSCCFGNVYDVTKYVCSNDSLNEISSQDSA